MAVGRKVTKKSLRVPSAIGAVGVETFASWLFGRVAREDVSAYQDDALTAAAGAALKAVKRQRRGDSVIDIASGPGLERQGRPLSVVTIVNDNMPFLFDSLLAEITEQCGEPTLVTHPILAVRHGRSGVEAIVGEAQSHRSETAASKVSLIQVHVEQLGEEQMRTLRERLALVLAHVRAAVSDWKPMLARLEQAIMAYRYSKTPLKQDGVDEAIAFLEWLRDDNFTFLGMREYRYSGGEKSGILTRLEKTGLGILADPDTRVLRGGSEAGTATTPEIRSFLHGPEPLIVTKANAKSLVHRRAYLDYIGVKMFNAAGKVAGELRIVGLFTSTAYTRSVLNIPYLRSKVQAVIARSGLNPDDHSGKALINVLESFPRDELFQISISTLRKHAEAVLALDERPRVRVLVRVDQFDRFVSVIVFVPRDRYDSAVREKIGTHLKTVFDGRVSAFYPAFPEGTLARVHFIIGRSGGKTPKVDPAAIEAAVRSMTRTWQDELKAAAAQSNADPAMVALAARLPQSYQGTFSAAEALEDVEFLARISADNPIEIRLCRHDDQDELHAALKIYHHGEPVSLSRRVPLLENMGFLVVSERTFELGESPHELVFVHDMELQSVFGVPISLEDARDLCEQVFLAVWHGISDNDGYNALLQTARLGVDQIKVLRAYGRYLQQAGIPQSQGFIAAALNRYPEIARRLHDLFRVRFDPHFDADARDEAMHAHRAQIAQMLDGVPNLDDDTILRRLFSLLEATLRTNHFMAGDDGTRPLVLKLDPRAVSGLPDPRPWREFFVYGPEVEGVHLRFGPVARGGLRWSDRGQDYRTEVLGLVKAQQVKNAVIVPVGAKGGFYPKRLPQDGGREAVFEAGKRAYVTFISNLLAVTDNLLDGAVVPPEGVVRHDEDDPYFVVAADKGTATFSDTANAISRQHDFWLDDAFASGGSAGYDHKKMGITARGAWEAVKRHFRELNRDIQTTPVSVVGVGDMSGDVFGNGMLLSRQIRLIAAFDHRDIFIDPDPDPERSFAERERLFNQSRTSWQDYDRRLLSEGGGIFSRSQKSIVLSAAAAAVLGLETTSVSPLELMSAILKAPVDLLWFGGIGTYVRGGSESNPEVGDRANDAIRIAAEEVRAKVVGEGANLGMTQHARIEYGLAGGRCNSDAIDNSAGVNSSDLEVNIKIALAAAMRQSRLTRPARDKLLADMTGEVADLVLANNYQQTLAITLVEDRGAADLPHQRRLITGLEARGLLDRAVEALPNDAALAERQLRGRPLARAEIGVLLSYAKIVLFSDLVASDLPDDPHLEVDLLAYFPDRMRRRFAGDIRNHRLRREIIATQLANDAINRAGPAFVSRLQDMVGGAPHEILRAYAVVREGFGLSELFGLIDALDNRIDSAAQLALYQRLVRVVYSETAWFLKNADRSMPLGQAIADLRQALQKIEPVLSDMLPAAMRQGLARREQALRQTAPDTLATRLARLDVTQMVPEIASVARTGKSDLTTAANAFFAISEMFRIGRLEDAARALSPTDYYDGLALARAIESIGAARHAIAVAALTEHAGEADPVQAWSAGRADRVGQTCQRIQALTESGEMGVSRLAVAAGLLSDVSRL